jgi:hypothetical protein
MTKQSDFSELVKLAEQQGYKTLFDYAEAARQDFLDKYGMLSKFDFAEMLSKPEWLKQWYPDAYQEHFHSNGTPKKVINGS